VSGIELAPEIRRNSVEEFKRSGFAGDVGPSVQSYCKIFG